MARRKNDPVRTAAVKNTCELFSVSPQHVRNIELHGATTLEAEEVKKFYASEYERLKTAMQPVPVQPIATVQP